MRNTLWLFLAPLLLALVNCSKAETPASPAGEREHEERERQQEKAVHAELNCGANKGAVFNRVRVSPSWDGKRFAILLAGSPGTRFFGDASSKTGELVNRLVESGFKTIEISYAAAEVKCGAGTATGFYALCCGQGLAASQRHAASLYDYAVKEVGFDPSDRTQTLVGAGFSLGSVQLMSAAYGEGRRFSRVALTGAMFGDNESGCLGGQSLKLDGLAWTWFMPLADFISRTTRGCSQKEAAPLEFTKATNFENLPHAQDGELALFEGLNRRLGAHDAQAKYVASKRRLGTTWLKFYEGCGHDAWNCSNASAQSLVSDHLKFLLR